MLVAVPDFLHDTLAVATSYRVVGEWDLELSPLSHGDEWSMADLARFQAAFPWINISAMHIRGQNGPMTWSAGSLPLTEWLTQHAATLRGSHGFEATLCPEFMWSDALGNSGDSCFPGTARLLLDAGERLFTFTLWINLHTDSIYVYERSDHAYARRAMAFLPASRLNRDRLAAALGRWEADTGGKIISWTSELVEGVRHHGFADNSVAL